MTIEAGSGQDPSQAPGAMMAGRREPPRPGGRRRRAIVASVEMTALARHLTSRRFMAQVITGAIALDAVRLGSSFPSDPADRIIAATARVHGHTLITADRRVRTTGVVAIL